MHAENRTRRVHIPIPPDLWPFVPVYFNRVGPDGRRALRHDGVIFAVPNRKGNFGPVETGRLAARTQGLAQKWLERIRAVAEASARNALSDAQFALPAVETQALPIQPKPLPPLTSGDVRQRRNASKLWKAILPRLRTMGFTAHAVRSVHGNPRSIGKAVSGADRLWFREILVTFNTRNVLLHAYLIHDDREHRYTLWHERRAVDDSSILTALEELLGRLQDKSEEARRLSQASPSRPALN